MASFSRNSPINCDPDVDAKNVEGKTAIVTGGKQPLKAMASNQQTEINKSKIGANGIGEAYVRALVTAG